MDAGQGLLVLHAEQASPVDLSRPVGSFIDLDGARRIEMTVGAVRGQLSSFRQVVNLADVLSLVMHHAQVLGVAAQRVAAFMMKDFARFQSADHILIDDPMSLATFFGFAIPGNPIALRLAFAGPNPTTVNILQSFPDLCQSAHA
jgi:hypothetical protein